MKKTLTFTDKKGIPQMVFIENIERFSRENNTTFIHMKDSKIYDCVESIDILENKINMEENKKLLLG